MYSIEQLEDSEEVAIDDLKGNTIPEVNTRFYNGYVQMPNMFTSCDQLYQSTQTEDQSKKPTSMVFRIQNCTNFQFTFGEGKGINVQERQFSTASSSDGVDHIYEFIPNNESSSPVCEPVSPPDSRSSFYWYDGEADKENIQRCFAGKLTGTFLVHPSSDKKRCLTLQVCLEKDKKFQKHKISWKGDHFWINKKCKFGSLQKLLAYYKTNPLPDTNICLRSGYNSPQAD